MQKQSMTECTLCSMLLLHQLSLVHLSLPPKPLLPLSAFVEIIVKSDLPPVSSQQLFEKYLPTLSHGLLPSSATFSSLQAVIKMQLQSSQLFCNYVRTIASFSRWKKRVLALMWSYFLVMKLSLAHGVYLKVAKTQSSLYCQCKIRLHTQVYMFSIRRSRLLNTLVCIVYVSM